MQLGLMHSCESKGYGDCIVEYNRFLQLDMDWTTPLRSQQADFIKRLQSGCLLHCANEGQHSELTVISGERLKQLRDFCWKMAEKYKQKSPVRDVFINNLKGKLAEEVFKARLADVVTEVDYKQTIGGDGKVDFRLNSDPNVGIQVKARQGSIDSIKWSISQEEVNKNAVLVCIGIQEEVNEAQPEYHLILAGFLPTNRITTSNGKASFGVDELLYAGGLQSYLENIGSLESDYLLLSIPKIAQKDKEIFEVAQNTPFSNDDITKAYACLSLGVNYYAEGNYEIAIEKLNEAIALSPLLTIAYYFRAESRSAIKDNPGAIEDYNQALRLIPMEAAKFYLDRSFDHYCLEDDQAAIKDFNQAIAINPNYALAYANRGSFYSCIYENQAGIKDLKKAAELYRQAGNEVSYQEALDKIKKLQQ
jgi:tetratricopeptide (TPR) repeat protein